MQKQEHQNLITKKIGTTYFIVNIITSATSKESFNDKLLRLIKAENPQDPAIASTITNGNEAVRADPGRLGEQ